VVILTHTCLSLQADFQHKFTVQASPTMDKRKSLISNRSSPPASPTIIPRLRAIQCETVVSKTEARHPRDSCPLLCSATDESRLVPAVTSATFPNHVCTHGYTFAEPQPSCSSSRCSLLCCFLHLSHTVRQQHGGGVGGGYGKLFRDLQSNLEAGVIAI
jgi:hypothetical protein